ncbi:hypothetical protein Hanom_Chr07g00680121 [Helianthus anomalus]
MKWVRLWFWILRSNCIHYVYPTGRVGFELGSYPVLIFLPGPIPVFTDVCENYQLNKLNLQLVHFGIKATSVKLGTFWCSASHDCRNQKQQLVLHPLSCIKTSKDHKSLARIIYTNATT